MQPLRPLEAVAGLAGYTITVCLETLKCGPSAHALPWQGMPCVAQAASHLRTCDATTDAAVASTSIGHSRLLGSAL